MAQKTTNYEILKGTAEEMAYALVEQEYCERCHYCEKGICLFNPGKEESSRYSACYDAAIKWLLEEVVK